jgi:hypothetical protein
MSALASAQRRLDRVSKFARFDGWSLIAVAGPSALFAASGRDLAATLAAVGVVLCGAMELHGRRQLFRHSLAGLNWMIAAQLSCLLLIVLYSVNLARTARADHLLALLPSFTREQLAELIPDPALIQRGFLLLQRLTAAAMAFAALLYQGGVAFYYGRSRSAAREVFSQPPRLDEGQSAGR